MSEKKLGKRLLTWVLVLVMMLSLLPVSALAADGTDETAEDGEVVLAPVAGVEEEETAPVEDAPMLLAAPAEGNAPTPVPADQLTFDKNKGAITGIDKTWLAANKDQPLSVTIPAEIDGTPVTSIGSQAFLWNTQLIFVDLSQAAITEIGSSAFNGCGLLEEVTFPNTLTKIGELAFDGCKSLKEVTFPDTLQTIGYQAFNSNEKLTSVDLSNTTVTTLGKLTFSKCTALREVILPSNLTELASSVFTDCKHVESIRLKSSLEGVVFELPESLISIGYQCFKNCFADGVEAKVVIPASVTTISGEAFKDIHITQIIFKKIVDPWKDQDYSGYENSAMIPPSGCDRIIVLPDNKCFVAYSTQVRYGSELQKICTYPIKIKFSPLGTQEQHLNHALLGWTYNPATKLWDFNNNYKLPDTNGATSGNERPGYEYVGGWKLRSCKQVLNENEKLEAKDNPSDIATVSGEYKLANPTISYLVDGESKPVGANQPFTVTIGDGKKHTLGVQVSHPLLLSEQGNEEDEYVYFEYCWWDEGYFSNNGTEMTVNGPRSTEEPNLFSKAETDRNLHRVWVKDNTIPIKKTSHARTDHNYYLVEICGYKVKDGNQERFYQSSNNFIQFGYSEGVATVRNYYTLQVEVDEVRVITATADANGTIDPSGEVAVPKGENQTFMITPNEGYHINDVLVDGKSVGAVTEYKFENVTEAHKIHATFARNYTPYYPIQPEQPKVDIPDDDALGLNTTDHFAYIVGYGNGQVRPQNAITRAEVATIFFRLLTDDVREENFTSTNKYTDVAAGAWYNNAVSTLSAMGIITGYPDGTFRPNAYITRAEFAAIAARFDADGDKTLAAFSDIANHWAKDEISVAYNNGWITGYPNGTFGPQRNITRAETVTLVNRVLNRKPEIEDDLLPDMTTWTDNADKKAWYYLAIQEATNSHYYEYKENSEYKKWTELRGTRDWTQLEK